MRRVSRVAAALVGLVAVAIAVSGCSWSKAPVAAEVGNRVVTAASVDQLVPTLEQAFGAAGNPLDEGVGTKLAIQGLVVGAMLEQSADGGASIYPASAIQSMLMVDPSVTDPAQRQALEAQAVLVQTILGVPNGATWMQGEMAVILSQNSEQTSQALGTLAASTPVTLNPRFGMWNAVGGGFSAQSSSLSVTEAELAQIAATMTALETPTP